MKKTNEISNESKNVSITQILNDKVKSATVIAKEFLKLKTKPMTFIAEKRDFYGQYLDHLGWKPDEFNPRHVQAAINKFKSLQPGMKDISTLIQKYSKAKDNKNKEEIGNLIIMISWLDLMPHLIFDERNHPFGVTQGVAEGAWLRVWMDADIETWSNWIREHLNEEEHYSLFLERLSTFAHNMDAVSAKTKLITPLFIFLAHIKGDLIPYA